MHLCITDYNYYSHCDTTRRDLTHVYRGYVYSYHSFNEMTDNAEID